MKTAFHALVALSFVMLPVLSAPAKAESLSLVECFADVSFRVDSGKVKRIVNAMRDTRFYHIHDVGEDSSDVPHVLLSATSRSDERARERVSEDVIREAADAAAGSMNVVSDVEFLGCRE
jgi:hypothetical protein